MVCTLVSSLGIALWFAINHMNIVGVLGDNNHRIFSYGAIPLTLPEMEGGVHTFHISQCLTTKYRFFDYMAYLSILLGKHSRESLSKSLAFLFLQFWTHWNHQALLQDSCWGIYWLTWYLYGQFSDHAISWGTLQSKSVFSIYLVPRSVCLFACVPQCAWVHLLQSRIPWRYIGNHDQRTIVYSG